MSKIERTKAIRKQARIWMLTNDIRSVDIQNALQMTNHTMIANTLAGRQNNSRVLKYLIEKGCPAEYLDLPKRMRREAVS